MLSNISFIMIVDLFRKFAVIIIMKFSPAFLRLVLYLFKTDDDSFQS